MSYVLGIDLGTTFTAAAVGRDGRVEMATLGNRAASLPSVVFLEADGTTIIGEAAERRGLNDPTRLAREFKRRVGDPTPLFIGGSPMAADVLVGRLLEAVIEAVATREGGPPQKLVVTHPANWGPYKTDLLEQAARRAGVESVGLVSEPVAAVTYYASSSDVPVGTVVAVYDLGGGTFDAAVLRKGSSGFEVLGRPEGIERLGGIDLDQAVLAHVDRALDGAVSEVDLDDESAMSGAARLHRECVEAKEALSDDTEATIGVFLPGRNDRVRLTRPELESMIRPSLVETVRSLRRAISSAGLTTEDVDRVLLVGGSSRIPLVAEMVGGELGRPVAVDAHPKHAIALGAALLALEAAQAGADAVVPGAEVDLAEVAPAPAAEPAPSPASTTPAMDLAPPTAPAEADRAVGAPPAPAPAPGPGVSASRGSRKGLLVAATVIVVGLLAAAGVAVLAGGGGNGDGGGTQANSLQPISFEVSAASGSCTATWSFEDDAFEEGDSLWLYADGVAVAKGEAVATGSQVSGSTAYDAMALVRDGEVVRRWEPAGSC